VSDVGEGDVRSLLLFYICKQIPRDQWEGTEKGCVSSGSKECTSRDVGVSTARAASIETIEDHEREREKKGEFPAGGKVSAVGTLNFRFPASRNASARYPSSFWMVVIFLFISREYLKLKERGKDRGRGSLLDVAGEPEVAFPNHRLQESTAKVLPTLLPAKERSEHEQTQSQCVRYATLPNWGRGTGTGWNGSPEAKDQEGHGPPELPGSKGPTNDQDPTNDYQTPLKIVLLRFVVLISLLGGAAILGANGYLEGRTLVRI
jgi:hypothetical protein